MRNDFELLATFADADYASEHVDKFKAPPLLN